MKKILFAFMAMTIALFTSCGGDDDPVEVIDNSPTEKTAILDIPANIGVVKGYIDSYNALPDNMKQLGLALMMSEVDGLKINFKDFVIEATDGKTGAALMEGELPYVTLYMPQHFSAECVVNSTNAKVKVKSVELVHHHKVAQDETEYFINAFNQTYMHNISNDQLLSHFPSNVCQLTPAPTYNPDTKSDLFDLTSSNGKFSIVSDKEYCQIQLTKIIVKYEVLP